MAPPEDKGFSQAAAESEDKAESGTRKLDAREPIGAQAGEAGRLIRMLPERAAVGVGGPGDVAWVGERLAAYLVGIGFAEYAGEPPADEGEA